MKILLVGFLVGICVFSKVRADDDGAAFEDSVYKEAVSVVMECGKKDMSLCFKERALKYLDKLPSNIDLGSGIKIKQVDGARSAKNYNPLVLPEEPRAREDAVENALYDKVSDFLGSHTMEFRLPTESNEELKDEGRKKQGGGGGGGKKGGGGMKMMMMLSMKAAIMGALALKFIALIAFKALIIAKIAFTISAIIALKKLLGSKQQTYEVVAHPHYEEHGGGGHYDRSFGSDLAYRGHLDSKISNVPY